MLRGAARGVAARALTGAFASTSTREFAPAIASAWWRPGVVDRAWADDRCAPSGASWGALGPSGWRHFTRTRPAAAPEKVPCKGFADTQDDDMGFVEVDLSMVSQAAESRARGPSRGVQGHMHGDVDWASIDFDRVCHYRVEVTTAEVRGAGTSGRVEITFIGDKGVSPPIPLEYQPGEGPGFMRGATLPFRVVNYTEIGKLSQIQVKLIPEMSQVGHGWMLESICVRSEEKCANYLFRSRKWFGESDCGGANGPLQQLLSAEAPEDRRAFAEGLAKRPRMDLQVTAAAACVPHVDKTKEGARAMMQRESGHAGEDAYFVKRIAKRRVRDEADAEDVDSDATDLCVALGVADGVFMWRKQGIDAGLFSRRLMGVASEVFADEEGKTLETRWDPRSDRDRPEALLQAAYEGVIGEKIKGSSTACIATVDAAYGLMRTANVGDSGFMLVRGDPGSRHVAHRSPHQEHEFGRPFQLGHHDASDRPSDAMLTTFPLEPGDVIVMGSDGLWDNLSESEILELVEELFTGTRYQRGLGAESQQTLTAASRAIVSAAYAASMDKRRTTPYSLAATENFDMVYSGGKKDDITAVVVNVG